MNKAHFHQLFEPQLENPVLVGGLAGIGNVGLTAARHLIEATGAKVFAELYSPYFQDLVIVKKDGTCRPPRYRFYAAKTEKAHYIILTGDQQPNIEDCLAYYDLCDEILDFAAKYGTKFVATIDGAITTKSGSEIYIAATSDELAQKHQDKGAKIYGEAQIIGATGLLLGLAKKRGWKGISLLGETTGFGTDRGVALSIYKILTSIIEAETQNKD